MNVQLRRSFRALALAALTLAGPSLAAAQLDDVPPPAAYALEDVTVVHADGQRVEGVTLVIRGAFIEALGTGVEPPADAELLDGDSLVVYPGFVDAYGAADHEFPEIEVDRSEIGTWNAPRSLQGFMPSRSLADHLTATGADLADQRTSGVVAAAVHPTGAMMPGRGALLLFRPDADRPQALVLRPELGPVMEFQGARGVYPGTLFGITAFIRQALEDARHRSALFAAHREDPRGVTTPAWDPDYAVLREALEGEAPVHFVADAAEEIRRVVRLSDEFGFRPVIVGGEEAWKVAELLRAKEIPVLFSLDFPEPLRWDPDTANEEEDAATEQEAAEEGEEAAGQELDAAAQREKQRLEAAWAAPGRLAEAGVQFVLTSGGGKADLREGARKAIEHGLAESRALAALTADPARLLGVSHLTRLEPGYGATLVVADGPLFEEGTAIRYTFVEGALERGAAAGGGGDEPPTVDVTGAWEMEMRSPAGSIEGRLDLTQDGASVSGEWSTQFGDQSIDEASVSGNELSITVRLGGGGGSVRMSGTVEGDTMRGSGSGPFGSFTWSAQRSPGGGS